MRSNYKKLGRYIRPVDIRNKDLEVDLLLGVSVKKIFIPSIANTVGTNFKNYKIVRRNQFTYIPDTSRRGDKIGLAMLNEHDIAIVSQAYTVFEIIDHTELNPEYLMMWFRRPEFDRYARFKSHGSVREIFDWEEMCEVELPIPDIEIQREIVEEYNTIVDRIKLNEQLNQKLEETAQALYKHWFVDFEFPDENGLPYKSNGGEMVWNEELEKEIPISWETGNIEILGEVVGGATPSKDNPEYWANNDGINWITPKDLTRNNYKFVYHGENFITDLGYKKSSTKLMPPNSVLFSSRAPIGILAITKRDLCTNQGFKSIIPKKEVGCHYVYYFLKFNTYDIANQGTGSTFDEVSGGMMKAYSAYVPNDILIDAFSKICQNIFDNQLNLEGQQVQLKELKSLLQSKMTKVEPLKEIV